jgi:hypothetical protein
VIVDNFEDLLTGVHSPTVTDVAVLVREVRLRVGVLSQEVAIRIFWDGNEHEPYRFETSALMKAGKDAPVRDGERGARSENEALRHAVRMLTQDYEEAVRRGEIPDDSWLVTSRQ